MFVPGFRNDAAVMKPYHLVSLMNAAPNGARWQIHRASCRDVEKRIKKGDVADIVHAESPEALVAAEGVVFTDSDRQHFGEAARA